MSYLKNLLQTLGGLIDAVVPVGVGSRTKVAVIACPLLGALTPVLTAAGAFFPPLLVAIPAIPLLQHILCAAAPAFAYAGLVRK